jgi:hypothetical protein
MKKQTKTLLAVAAVVGVGFYLWKQNQDKKNFLTSRRSRGSRIFANDRGGATMGIGSTIITPLGETTTNPCGCFGRAGSAQRGIAQGTLNDGTTLCTNSSGYTYGCKGSQFVRI